MDTSSGFCFTTLDKKNQGNFIRKYDSLPKKFKIPNLITLTIVSLSLPNLITLFETTIKLKLPDNNVIRLFCHAF